MVSRGRDCERNQALGTGEGARPVKGSVDVALPDLTRQLVQHLNAVAVRIGDVDAVCHAVIDAAVELHALALQEGDLLQP